MNWDNTAPLELLAHMPSKLTGENLAKIQEVIDKNKYECSVELNRDLCGEYAPFCFYCDKQIKYPCAVSYVKMKREEGAILEIAAADEIDENAVESAQPADGENAEEKPVESEETAVENPAGGTEETESAEETQEEPTEPAEEAEETENGGDEEKSIEGALEEGEPKQMSEDELQELIDSEYGPQPPEEPKKRIRIALARRRK